MITQDTAKEVFEADLDSNANRII